MPKLRRRAGKYDALQQLILGRMTTDGVTFTALHEKTGITRQALSTKLKEAPENLTLGELASIATALQIPIEEIREKIPK